MRDIDELRQEIDSINTDMMELFRRRMEVSAEIAAYKREHHLPVRDPEREQAILDRIGAQAGDELADYARELFRTLFELSRTYQESCGEGA